MEDKEEKTIETETVVETKAAPEKKKGGKPKAMTVEDLPADVLAKIRNSEKLAAEREEAARKKEAEEKARIKAEKAAARKKAAEDKKRGMAIPDRTDIRFAREFNMCVELNCAAIVILDATLDKVLPGSYYRDIEEARKFFEIYRGHKDPNTFVCLMDAYGIKDLY